MSNLGYRHALTHLVRQTLNTESRHGPPNTYLTGTILLFSSAFLLVADVLRNSKLRVDGSHNLESPQPCISSTSLNFFLPPTLILPYLYCHTLLPPLLEMESQAYYLLLNPPPMPPSFCSPFHFLRPLRQ